MPAADWAAVALSPAVAGLIGLLVGSFLNVVIHRLPAMYMRGWWAFDVADFALSDKRSWAAAFGRGATPPPELAAAAGAVNQKLEALPALSLWRPGSQCPACGHRLRASENIPVISWLALGRRCSACKSPISWRYPLIELATAALFAASAWRYGATAMTLVACTAAALLVVMALIDLEFTLLPDSLTIPLVVLGLAAAASGWSAVPWREAATGALAGYGILWALGVFWAVVFRKPNAMAEGDMKMLAGIGALLGWQALPGVLLLSAGVGSVVGVGLIMLGGHKRETPIPFGPYLALAGVIALLARDAVAAIGAPLAALFGL